jgi:branched-chain amino acid transport system permease protein
MLLQQILNGTVSGAVYALFALGFTLIFGVQKLLNLAHGAIFMAGAFIAYYATINGLPFWFAVVLAVIATGLVSIVTDFVAFRQLRKQGHAEFAAIVTSLGVDLILMNIAQQVSRTQVLSFPFGTFPVEFYRGFGMRISLLQIVILVLVVVLVAALYWYIHRTSFGRQIRAVSSNETTSALLGVSAQSVYLQTFFIAGALAGLAGVLIGLQFNSIHFMMGEPFLLQAFVVVVIGGLGSLMGAVLAALFIGIVQSLTIAYLSSELSIAIIFTLLFVTLLFFPNGFFGKADTFARGSRR